MDTPIISSDPPANPSKSSTPAKPKKRKMSAAGRKAVSDAARARWAAKKTVDAPVEVTPVPAVNPVTVSPAPPSPAVLALQEQVVSLVSQRHQARTLLNEAHNAYLAAQSRFQAAEGELKGIEQEVQYRIGLIAQLENRQPVVGTGWSGNAPVLQMPAVSGNITSEPAQQPTNREQFAVALADDVRREYRGMM